MDGLMTFADELRAALPGAQAPNRRAVFVGVLNKYLPGSRRAVLVGGGAVEFYSRGAYVTADVDLVGDREAVARLLADAGFESSGRYFASRELDLVVEVPGFTLRPTETVQEVEVRGYKVPIVAPEDSVVDRLLAAKYWESQTDWEQSILLWRALADRLDLETLRSKARANEVEDFVEELVKLAPAGEIPSRPRAGRDTT